MGSWGIIGVVLGMNVGIERNIYHIYMECGVLWTYIATSLVEIDITNMTLVA